MGLEAFVADIYADTLTDNIELNDMGYLMALTGNSDINRFVIQKFQGQFGENGAFRLVDSDEMTDPDNSPREGLFSHTDDFIQLTETARKFPAINEIDLDDKAHYDALIEASKTDSDVIPIFLKKANGRLEIISSFSKEFEVIEEGSKLVYLGKLFDLKENPVS